MGGCKAGGVKGDQAVRPPGRAVQLKAGQGSAGQAFIGAARWAASTRACRVVPCH